MQDRFIGWQEVHANALATRAQDGYNSETEEQQYQERKGAGTGKKATGRKAEKRNSTRPRSHKTATKESEKPKHM